MLINSLSQLLYPLLHLFPPEFSHNVTHKLFSMGISPNYINEVESLLDKANEQGLNLACKVNNISFKHPIGLAAGFDKSAKNIESLSKIGFSFCEIGAITPLPQKGNSKPRLFRLCKDKAIINAMGFNNDGLEKISVRLTMVEKNHAMQTFNIGANIGANKQTEDKEKDYEVLLAGLHNKVDFICLNISSPNTKDLRSYQYGEGFKKICHIVTAFKKTCQADAWQTPVWLKISPDISFEQLTEIAKTIDIFEAIVIGNTTMSRDNLSQDIGEISGGLSGSPLKERSDRLIKNFYKLTDGKVSIIGVGGVTTGKDVIAKIKAGATIIELYTALIYQGPKIIVNILTQIIAQMQSDGVKDINHYRE